MATVALVALAPPEACGQQTPQRYRVKVDHQFTPWGDVSAGGCAGKCAEGHDCTTCVGTRVYEEQGVVLTTAIYDKESCCQSPPGTNKCPNLLSWIPKPFGCGTKQCPCPGPATQRVYEARLRYEVGCAEAGRPVWVPRFVAIVGNVVNNTPSCGALCSPGDPFEPYPSRARADSRWGGFEVACPSQDPAIICEPVAECPGSYLPSTVGLQPTGTISTRNPAVRATAQLPPGAVLRTQDGAAVVLKVWRQEAPTQVFREIRVHAADAFASETSIEFQPSLHLPNGYYRWTIQVRTSVGWGQQSDPLYFTVETTEPGGDMRPSGCDPDQPLIQVGSSPTSVGEPIDLVVTGGLAPVPAPHWDMGGPGTADGMRTSFTYPVAGRFTVIASGIDTNCGVRVSSNPILVEVRDARACVDMGGQECSPTVECPAGFSPLGPSAECTTCCTSCQPTACRPGDCGWQSNGCGGYQECGECGPTCQPRQCLPGECGWQDDACTGFVWCGACDKSCVSMGGALCSQTGVCPAGNTSIGPSNDCAACCIPLPAFPSRTCSSIGGDFCSPVATCPAGKTSLGGTSDCPMCCHTLGPPAPRLFAPDHNAVVGSSMFFDWERSDGASDFVLKVVDSGGATRTWSVSAAVCAATRCTRTVHDLSWEPPSGLTRWSVQARNGEGEAWSPTWSFSIVPGPGRPEPVSPSGTIDTRRPVFRWRPGTGATSYRLTVESIGTIDCAADKCLASRICSDSICQISSEELGIEVDPELCDAIGPPGCTWSVLAVNDLGTSLWSDALAFEIAIPSCGDLGGEFCSETPSCPAYHRSLGPSGDCVACCDAVTCTAMGGDYCSQTGSCPPRYDPLGGSSDCATCCQTKTCEELGGSYCSPTAGSCPATHTSLGPSNDCASCCRPKTCPELGGQYCSQTSSCPSGATSLGPSAECQTCCQLRTCGEMGGGYCSQTASCPANHVSLGRSRDCQTCCDPVTCAEMGGSYCSDTGSCPSRYSSLGASANCAACCRLKSCPELGGSYCSPTAGSCPATHTSLGPSNDCASCCRPKTCPELGGQYCSQTSSCPSGATSLGPSAECQTCCQLRTCGEMGGGYCSQTASCPAYHVSLGRSRDCQTCCDPVTCAEMGGSYCSGTGSCPSRYSSLGASANCAACCRLKSCPELGGSHCSSTSSCPAGYANLGAANGCTSCCRAQTCSELGGQYCSQSGACPAGYTRLGPSSECTSCCRRMTCGELGGDYCSGSYSCPSTHDSLGASSDCRTCCREKPSCGAMGGDYCSGNASCPANYTSLGASGDCTRCCKLRPSCGEMGGSYCSQSGSCPSGYSSLGPSGDCNPCCG